MGAEFDYFSSRAKTTTELKNEYISHCQSAQHESGSSYSGRINMTSGLTITDKVFNSYSEASNYVSENAKKWEDALAVRYKDIKVEPSKKLEKIKKQIVAEANRSSQIMKDFEESFRKKMKVKAFHTCPNCKSKINTEHLSSFYNPHRCIVCRHEAIPAAIQKKIEASKKKLETLQQKRIDEVNNITAKAAAKSDTYVWFVGGMCSC